MSQSHEFLYNVIKNVLIFQLLVSLIKKKALAIVKALIRLHLWENSDQGLHCAVLTRISFASET